VGVLVGGRRCWAGAGAETMRELLPGGGASGASCGCGGRWRCAAVELLVGGLGEWAGRCGTRARGGGGRRARASDERAGGWVAGVSDERAGAGRARR
jgi:hypothetical protein